MMKALRLAMVTIMLVTVSAVATAPAQAHNTAQHTRLCLLSLHRNNIGALDANSGTCDGDAAWAGRLRDNHATSDGHCVTVLMQGIRMADSCNSSGIRFTFRDPNGYGDANTRICLANLTRCWEDVNINF